MTSDQACPDGHYLEGRVLGLLDALLLLQVTANRMGTCFVQARRLVADLEIRRVLLDSRLAPTLLTSSSRSGLDFVNVPLASLVNGLAVEFLTASRFRNLIGKASMS